LVEETPEKPTHRIKHLIQIGMEMKDRHEGEQLEESLNSIDAHSRCNNYKSSSNDYMFGMLMQRSSLCFMKLTKNQKKICG
jgi:hypothetical protein